jgi:hypothetical protein
MRLTPEPADHLRKLLMLSSAHNGEVLNVVRLADQFLRRQNLQRGDVIGAPQSPPPPPSLPPWQEIALRCHERPDLLNGREADFVINISRQWRPPSERQLAWLEVIYLRILERAA